MLNNIVLVASAVRVIASALGVSVLFFSSLLSVGQAQSTATTLVPAIITFGDSSVDVGNNDYLPAMFKADFPPYGRDFTTHLPTGRFCNGKLVTDFTAETLGFTSPPPAYLSPQASGKNLLIGASFASAGSGYYENTSVMYHAISLYQQVIYYKEYQSKLAKVAGAGRAKSIIAEAMHILSTGNGDYVQNYHINPSLRKVYSPDEYSSLLISTFSSFIKDLYGLGARRIGVTSLPPLGCLPASVNLFGHGSKACIPRLNINAQRFNQKLNATVNSLKKQLPRLKIVVFDIYKPLMELVTAPSRYGFAEARKSCCVAGGTSGTLVLCKPNNSRVGVCGNATQYVFWDGVHPSQAANQVIAESLLFQGISLIS